MFTGLVQDVGRLESIQRRGSGATLKISTAMDWRDFQEGESIAVEGACLTVTSFGEGFFWVDCSPETLERTTLGKLKVGSPLHLERALRLSDRLGGHLLTGHIDGVGKIKEVKKVDNSLYIELFIPKNLMKYIVEKGSIAIDGVSLTVNKLFTYGISLMIIPHTLEKTHIDHYTPGREVNLEVDILAKYVERIALFQREEKKESKIDEEFLKKYGFWK